jgi:SAM-dependent methyltransferase
MDTDLLAATRRALGGIFRKSSPREVTVTFTCNICGSLCLNIPLSRIDREVSSCEKCGSSVRFRSIIHLLSTTLFGKSIPLSDFPVDKSISGIGLSDAMYADRLSRALSYTNTFFHMEPRLDITKPDSYRGTCDFIIATEVFEHVPPPVSRAFCGAFDVLKPAGSFIFSVPFKLEGGTTEHFPNLRNYEIVNEGDEQILINHLPDGSTETHRDLIFHGGDGATLEMRLFSRDGLLQNLKDAGFIEIQFLRENVHRYGIINKYPWSLPLVARKSASPPANRENYTKPLRG